MKECFDKKILLFFMFSDNGLRPLTVAAVITIDSKLSPSRVRDEIEDSFSSYLESHDLEELPTILDTVDIILSASGYQYEIVVDRIPAVDTYRTLYI